MTPRKSVHFDPDAHPPGDDGGPMFGARSTDPATSHAAAEKIGGVLSRLQLRVLGAFVLSGPMTAAECEARDDFSDFKASTVKKRCGELLRMGRLADTGLRRDGCAVLKVKGTQ